MKLHQASQGVKIWCTKSPEDFTWDEIISARKISKKPVSQILKEISTDNSWKITVQNPGEVMVIIPKQVHGVITLPSNSNSWTFLYGTNFRAPVADRFSYYNYFCPGAMSVNVPAEDQDWHLMHKIMTETQQRYQKQNQGRISNLKKKGKWERMLFYWNHYWQHGNPVPDE